MKIKQIIMTSLLSCIMAMTFIACSDDDGTKLPTDVYKRQPYNKEFDTYPLLIYTRMRKQFLLMLVLCLTASLTWACLLYTSQMLLEMYSHIHSYIIDLLYRNLAMFHLSQKIASIFYCTYYKLFLRIE